MEGSFLQILLLLLAIYQALALGSSSVVILALQRLSVMATAGILVYSSIMYTSACSLNRRKIPGILYVPLVLLSLASLLSLGSPNTVCHLLQRLFTWLLSGIGGIELWYCEMPPQLLSRKNPGKSGKRGDLLGYDLSAEQREAYDTICDQQRTIAAKDKRISALELEVRNLRVELACSVDLCEKQDRKLLKHEEKIVELRGVIKRYQEARKPPVMAANSFMLAINPPIPAMPPRLPRDIAAKIRRLELADEHNMKAIAFLQEENSRYALIHGEHLAALETQKGKKFADEFFGRTFIPQNFGVAGRAAIVEPNKLVQAQLPFQLLQQAASGTNAIIEPNKPVQARLPFQSLQQAASGTPNATVEPNKLVQAQLSFQPLQQAEPGTASLPFQPPQAEPVQAPAHTWTPQAQPSLAPAGTADAPAVDSAAEDKSADLPTLEEVDEWLLGNTKAEEEAAQPQTSTCAAGPSAPAAFASAPVPASALGPAASAPSGRASSIRGMPRHNVRRSAAGRSALSRLSASALDSLAASATAGPSAAGPSTAEGSNAPAGPSAVADIDPQRLFVRGDNGVWAARSACVRVDAAKEAAGQQAPVFAAPSINFICLSEDNLSTEHITLSSDKTFLDLERAWLQRKGTSVGTRQVDYMEYGTSLMALKHSDLISSNALMMKEEFAEVNFSLK